MTTETFIQPFKSVANYFSRIGRDVNSVIERDPAARSKLEVMLVYSGLHAIWLVGEDSSTMLVDLLVTKSN